jgi:hypothetical protein
MDDVTAFHERIDWMLKKLLRQAQDAIAKTESEASTRGALQGGRRIQAVLQVVQDQFENAVDTVVAFADEQGRLDDHAVALKLENFATKLKGVSRLQGAMSISGMEQLIEDEFEKIAQHLQFALRQASAGLHRTSGNKAVTSNSVNISNSVVGGVQQGTTQSIQSVQQSLSVSDVTAALEAFEAKLAGEKLAAQEAADLRSDVEAIKLQLGKSQPDKSIIQALGRGLKYAVEKVGSAVLAAAGLALWKSLGI